MEPVPNPPIDTRNWPVAQPPAPDPANGPGYQPPHPAYQPQQYPQQQYPQQAPAAYPDPRWQPPNPLVTDRSEKPGQMIVAWVLTVFTIGYFLPWAIAASRGKSNSGVIGLLNLLLGWTFIGWVVALVMACGTHQVVSSGPTLVVQQYGPQYPPQYPQQHLAPTPPGYPRP